MEESLYKLINTEFDIKSIQSERIKFIFGGSCRLESFPKKLDEHLANYLEATLLVTYMKMGERNKAKLIDRILKKVFRDQEDERNRELMSDFDMGGLDILIDIFDPDLDHYLYDHNIGEVSEINYEGLKNFVSPKQIGLMDKHPCRFVYDPLSGAKENFTDHIYRQRPIKKVNVYKHPEWRKDIEISNSPVSSLSFGSIPESAQVFFKHLFPDQDSLEHALDWLYVALTSLQGNEHILVLNGPTGTGKTIFCSDLLIALVGESNWGTAPKNLFESTFNKVLLNKRLIYIDEARINERDYNTVKLYANKRLNVEKKGVDADNTSDLYFSMALSNNKIGNIYVDPDDRRFSIPDTTNLKMKETLGEDFPRDFCEDLRDKDFIGAIGKYILSRHEDDELFQLDQFKGDRFYKFVERHLSQWQKVICARIFKVGKEGDDEIEISTLVSAISVSKHIRYDVQPDTVIEFLESYAHRGVHLLGELEAKKEDGEERMLKINPEFVEGAETMGDML